MKKYIILWNYKKEEVDFNSMNEVEQYANNLITEDKIWISITLFK